MKVYIVWYIPDYIGLDIVGVFANEKDAYDALDQFLLTDTGKYYLHDSGVDEYEVQ